MENVDALLHKKNLGAFTEWCNTLRAMGYTNSYKVLNAKDYGIPQNRKRVFMVSTLHLGRFEFPEKRPLQLRLKDMLEESAPESFYLKPERIASYERHRIRQEEMGRGFGWRPEDPDEVSVARTVTNNHTRNCGNFIIDKTAPAEMIEAGNLNNDTTFRRANTVFSGEGIAPTNTAEHMGINHPKVEVEEPKLVLAGDLHQENRLEQHNRVYDSDGLSPTVFTPHGCDQSPKIEVRPIKTYTKVRKHKVDREALVTLLRSRKDELKLSISSIAESLGRSSTEVEHWFRTDEYGTIPTEDIWFALKSLLSIPTDEYDAPIMEFEEVESEYDMSNRCYGIEGISPTVKVAPSIKIEDDEPGIVRTGGYLGKRTQHYTVYSGDGVAPTMSACDDKDPTKIEIPSDNPVRIRYLTPRECLRLMGQRDGDIDKLMAAEPAKTVQYRLAGNSIVVDVLEEIFRGIYIGKTFVIPKHRQCSLEVFA